MAFAPGSRATPSSAQFTGVSPYEAPIAPELVLDTTVLSPDESAAAIIALLDQRGLLSSAS